MEERGMEREGDGEKRGMRDKRMGKEGECRVEGDVEKRGIGGGGDGERKGGERRGWREDGDEDMGLKRWKACIN